MLGDADGLILALGLWDGETDGETEGDTDGETEADGD